MSDIDCYDDETGLPCPVMTVVALDLPWQADNFATGAAVAFGLMGMAEEINIWHATNLLVERMATLTKPSSQHKGNTDGM